MLVMPTRVSEQRIYDNGVTGFPKEMHLARVSRTMRASKESHGFTSRVQDFSDARSRGIETSLFVVCPSIPPAPSHVTPPVPALVP